MVMKKLVWLVLFLSGPVLARNLGTFGETFPIQEENLLSFIQAKLSRLQQSGELEQHQIAVVRRVTKSIQTPTPVEGLITTKQARTFYYDPSIQVPYDLKDHKEVVFQKAGTRFNPLELYSLKRPLLLINGEDLGQVDFAKSQKDNPKIILVKGAPIALMKEQSKPIYFDQGGALVRKLGIKQVPAKVVQEGKQLVISELSLLEEDK